MSALDKTFFLLDELVKGEEYSMDIGATCCVVLITGEEIYCASAGDSRAILVKKDGQVVPLSEDHKPYDPREKERIDASGHFVEDKRVDSFLGVARAIGDHKYKDKPDLPPEKQAVTCKPDIRVVKRSADDDYIMTACDGIWDCLSNEECALFISERMAATKGTVVLTDYIAEMFD